MATPADKLYGTIEKLEKKITEYGLQNKFKGTIAGAASGLANQETKQKLNYYQK